MTSAAARQKGRRLVLHLVEEFRKTLDSKAYEITGSGAGLDKNDLRLPTLNIEVECKNAAKVNLVKDWDQTKRQMTGENLSVLAIRNPSKAEFVETLIVMDVGDFIELVKAQQGEVEVISNFSNDLKWKARRLVEAAKAVLKELE